MSVYILDREYNPLSNSGREWHLMLPDPVPVEFNNFARPTRILERTTHKPLQTSVRRDLIVAHRSTIEGNPHRVDAVKATRIPLLIVSRNSHRSDLPNLEESKYPCYYRRAGILERSEGIDAAFRDLFLKFWDKYQQPEGELDWALLEPEPWPRNLMAVYLVAKCAQLSETTHRGAILLEWKEMDKDWKGSVWQRAFAEYRGQGGSLETWRSSGLPDLAQESGTARLDFTDEQLGSAVEAIQSVFRHQ